MERQKINHLNSRSQIHRRDHDTGRDPWWFIGCLLYYFIVLLADLFSLLVHLEPFLFVVSTKKIKHDTLIPAVVFQHTRGDGGVGEDAGAGGPGREAV